MSYDTERRAAVRHAYDLLAPLNMEKVQQARAILIRALLLPMLPLDRLLDPTYDPRMSTIIAALQSEEASEHRDLVLTKASLDPDYPIDLDRPLDPEEEVRILRIFRGESVQHSQ
jgi:hypothetical protein